MLIEDALERGLDVLGLHVHVGSQLADFDAQAETIVRLAAFAARCRDELGWTARVADLGGGFGIRHHADEHAPEAAELAASAVATARTGLRGGRAAEPEVWLEPGRSLVGPAGVTLYRVGAVKRLPERTWVAIDGGMSDNPRPQLYEAGYTALSADARDEHRERACQHRGHALRVGRRAHRRCRAPRPASRRPARRARHRRVHARDGVELQRRHATGGGARARRGEHA